MKGFGKSEGSAAIWEAYDVWRRTWASLDTAVSMNDLLIEAGHVETIKGRSQDFRDL